MSFEDVIQQQSENQVLTVGRFSSQMLKLRGARKTVKQLNGKLTNTFDASQGDAVALPPDSLLFGNAGLVAGGVTPDVFHAVVAYFSGRGVGQTNAVTMAALTTDAAKIQGISAIKLLENFFGNTVVFNDTTMSAFNALRNPNNQIGIASDISNGASPRARNVLL